MECEHRQADQAGTTQVGRVVIVDDDRVCLAALERAFRRQGLQTVSFEDGVEAWQGIQASPDVLLFVANWMLPSLDGHWICRRLTGQRPLVTTVLMVGRRFLSEVWPRMRLQADYALAKPFRAAGVEEEAGLLAALAFDRRAAGAGVASWEGAQKVAGLDRILVGNRPGGALPPRRRR